MREIGDMINLRGRVGLITGGAGHLGFAIGQTLAELGVNVALLDVQRERCLQAADQIEAEYQVEATPIVVDMENEGDLRLVADQVAARFGRLDILVHCAALVGTSELSGWAVPFGQQSPETWRKALEINLTAPFVLTQACAEALTESGHGSVINIGSIYGVTGTDNGLYRDTEMAGVPGAYAASKGGLVQWARWLATQLAPRVRVNSITMGGVWRNQDEAFHRRYKERTPLQRMATEEDIKGAVAYLASDLSQYVTGQNLIVDGGWTAW
jgi:NAD(P)-dependent dehydrogenase (short-subunit alcohol dehydrogenase family)